MALLGESHTQAADPTWRKTMAPFLQKFCVGCHHGSNAPGGLRLDSFMQAEVALNNRAVFELVAEKIKEGQMPPPGVAQPTKAQRDGAILAIQKLFAKAPPSPADPGRVTMRRLNRAEYDNTIRDLLQIEFQASKDFPNDDVGYGFDNIGDVLSLSPLLFEKYLNAAEQAAAKAIVLPVVRTARFDAGQMDTDRGLMRGGALALNSLGYGGVAFKAARPGLYRVRLRAWAQNAGPDLAKIGLRLDGKQETVFSVQAGERSPETFEVLLELAAGPNKIEAYFLNDYYQPQHQDPKMRGDRNLHLVSFEIHGPLMAEPPKPASHRALIVAVPGSAGSIEAAKTNLRPFLKRAFRRPVAEEEVERYAKLVEVALKEGEPFEQGMRGAVAAALVSPHFLFRVEMDAGRAGAGRVRAMSDYELASRLSYFLWSSMPDEPLFSLAGQGKLRDPEMLKAQALRMLKDPKAKALTENFATQWLTLRKLETASPDPELFPTYSEDLRQDMEAEAKAVFSHIVQKDASVIEFLDAPYTFLNERLAKHYGIAGVSGASFRRVPLKSSQRGGLLTSAAVLTVTSNPNRTSPVKRGKWLLENILGAPPPPPPPGLDGLEEGDEKAPSKTIKERMARHRKDPSCAVCHAKMDPLGIAFESYDAVGRWRTMDGRFKVDSTGVTASGEKFSGAADLKKILLKRKGEFVRTLAEKLFVYALGRGAETSDRKAIQAIADHASKEGFRFSALVKGVVASDAFRRKRVE
jgi:hypothetical protein